MTSSMFSSFWYSCCSTDTLVEICFIIQFWTFVPWSVKLRIFFVSYYSNPSYRFINEVNLSYSDLPWKPTSQLTESYLSSIFSFFLSLMAFKSVDFYSILDWVFPEPFEWRLANPFIIRFLVRLNLSLIDSCEYSLLSDFSLALSAVWHTFNDKFNLLFDFGGVLILGYSFYLALR